MRDGLLSILELSRLTKRYGREVRALDEVELSVDAGTFLTLLGPSGSGKTTLLRVVAGLEAPTSGAVFIAGRPAGGVPPAERGVAMVFQEPALYPHLDVFENVAFGLRARRVGKLEVRRRVDEVTSLLRVDHVLDRRPERLSGGERQRAALARALVIQPRLLLLDEPFKGLDTPLREALRDELLRLHRRFGTTTVLVTHDQTEALAVGDRVAVLDRGRLLQHGTPREVYDEPACRFVARFVGSPPMNLIPVEMERVEDSIRLRVHKVVSQMPDETSWLAPLRHHRSRQVELGVRAENVRLATERAGSSAFLPLSGSVSRLEVRGHETLAHLDCEGMPLVLRLGAEKALSVGQRVSVRLEVSKASWFDPATGRRLLRTPQESPVTPGTSRVFERSLVKPGYLPARTDV